MQSLIIIVLKYLHACDLIYIHVVAHCVHPRFLYRESKAKISPQNSIHTWFGANSKSVHKDAILYESSLWDTSGPANQLYTSLEREGPGNPSSWISPKRARKFKAARIYVGANSTYSLCKAGVPEYFLEIRSA